MIFLSLLVVFLSPTAVPDYTIWVPKRCVPPLIAFYAAHSLYDFKPLYGEFLLRGEMTVEGCRVALQPPADVVVPKLALGMIAADVLTHRSRQQLDDWLYTFGEDGCVDAAMVRVCAGERP